MKTRFLAALVLFGGIIFSFVITAQTITSDPDNIKLVRAARVWTKIPIKYDGSYIVITYPGGDPGGRMGVCTDLVIRSYRSIGIDLQLLVHKDIKKKFNAYPVKKLYDQNKPDKNIDHRRVPNLMAFFKRHGQTLTMSYEKEELQNWLPGDIVVFDLFDNGIPTHIGVVSDKISASGRPLIIHHFPPHPTEDDCLTTWKIMGHFRYFPGRKPVLKDVD
jgi:uncharacterized protein